MKAREKVKISTLRLLVAAFKNRQIEFGHELSDDEAADVVAKSAKQRRESIEAFKNGDRDDLASKEEAELGILAGYLPQQLSEEEIAKIVCQVISEPGENALVDFGKVMGETMKRIKGKAAKETGKKEAKK